ncbi:MAG: hypothetical protein ACRDN9_20115, partial [Streptosporangiaceae bacterium]
MTLPPERAPRVRVRGDAPATGGHGFRELGRAGALLVAVSVALVIAVGVLGPSATQPPLGGGYGA